jgi:hypothetical protein
LKRCFLPLVRALSSAVSKVNPNYAIAIGSSSSTGLIKYIGTTAAVTYPQYFSYTNNKYKNGFSVCCIHSFMDKAERESVFNQFRNG